MKGKGKIADGNEAEKRREKTSVEKKKKTGRKEGNKHGKERKLGKRNTTEKGRRERRK